MGSGRAHAPKSAGGRANASGCDGNGGFGDLAATEIAGLNFRERQAASALPRKQRPGFGGKSTQPEGHFLHFNFCPANRSRKLDSARHWSQLPRSIAFSGAGGIPSYSHRIRCDFKRRATVDLDLDLGEPEASSAPVKLNPPGISFRLAVAINERMMKTPPHPP